jgi:hypothetical protein
MNLREIGLSFRLAVAPPLKQHKKGPAGPRPAGASLSLACDSSLRECLTMPEPLGRLIRGR